MRQPACALTCARISLPNQNYWQPETQTIQAYPDRPNSSGEITWDIMLTALNCLSDATAHYLGKIVVAKTWRNTRPDDDALEALNLNRDGHFVLADRVGPSQTDVPITDKTHAALKPWVDAFATRCARIIRDYRKMVLEQRLDKQQRAVLQIPDLE